MSEINSSKATNRASKAASGYYKHKLLILSVCVVFFLALAVALIPTFDGPNSHQHAREAVAVGGLVRITALQRDYAALHVAQGFACQLPALKPISAAAENDQSYASLLSGDHAGYRFSFVMCKAESSGAVTQYLLTATPIEPGRSGVRAFCTDQSGTLWYDPNGSADNCLAFRRKLD